MRDRQPGVVDAADGTVAVPLTLVRTPVRLSELAEKGVALGAVRLALADVERRVLAMP